MRVRVDEPRGAHAKKTMGCSKRKDTCPADFACGVVTLCGMCRNIRTLHNFEPPATEDEIRASALQYVRKVSGSTKPSKANEAAFERAVDEVAEVTSRLLDSLVTNAPPKNREVEAAKLRERSAKRFAAA